MAKRTKSHQDWTWSLMIVFIILSIVDYRFGILGIVCMGAPMFHALRGAGKIHCSHYCPRGSLLGKFLKNISLGNDLPKWARSKKAKNILLIFMMTMFLLSMYRANSLGFNMLKTGFALFRFMMASLIVGIAMGIIFKPRTWCQVCPMGYGTALIDKVVKK